MGQTSIFQFADSYKLSHWGQYPDDVRYVYSNFTGRRSIDGRFDKYVFFGLQAFLCRLDEAFDRLFFHKEEETVVHDYVTFYRRFFMTDPAEADVQRIRDLHRLGYLPLQFNAVHEGTELPFGVPCVTVVNTHPDFPWVTNFIESWMSSVLWGPCTSATIALKYRRLFDSFEQATCDPEARGFFLFQGHDFSFRGMSGIDAAAASGAGHLLSFRGSDSLPSISWIDQHYGGTFFDALDEGELLATSVPATEHSVMCAGGEEDELGTFSRLLDLYPTGILSVVSDTWDFWKVITEILPALKDRILARDGKLVIRPDSSPKTPVEIICGDPEAPEGTPEHNGLIQELWDLFGGTVNSLGYKVLNPHIGAIYGDSITYQYARQILEGLQKKGFASSNVVMGIGSYTYQYNTRDTLGFAMKATGVGVEVDGEIVWKPIFKDPKTDNGTKKSARGFLAVVKGQDGDLKVVQRETPAAVEGDLLDSVFVNGVFVKPITFSEARRTLESMVE